MSAMYYNPIASFWEPLLEHTKIRVEMDEFSMKLRCNHSFDVNLSDTFINVIAMTWKSWNDKKSSVASSFKVPQRKSAMISGSQIERLRRNENEQGVCPFSVKNDTGTAIYLSKKMVNEIETEKVEISSASTLDIKVNYEETIGNLLKTSNNNVRLTDMLFQVSFDNNHSYLPIQGINFNKVGSTIHYLSAIHDSFNYLVCSITLDKMIKLLTIRTPLQLINKSEYNFTVVFNTNPEREYQFLSGTNFSIPVDCMNANFYLYCKETKSKSEIQSAERLMKLFSKGSSVFFLTFH